MNQLKYPLSKLIYEVFSHSNLSRKDFVEKLGYRNIAKSLRHLDSFLERSTGPENFLERAEEVFGVSKERIEIAKRETAEIWSKEEQEAEKRRKERARRTFLPFLYVDTSRTRPSSITLAAIAGKALKHIPVPEILETASLIEQLEWAQQIAPQHYEEKDHKVTLFGDIIGYILCYSYDEALYLGVDGELYGKVPGPAEWTNSLTAQVGNKLLREERFR